MATTSSGPTMAERFATSTVRAVSDVLQSIAEGIRARDDYQVRVSSGDEPAKAAAAAMRYVEGH